MKTIVITGCSQGIGYHTATSLCKVGMTVIGIARNEQVLRQLEDNYPTFKAVPFDLSQSDFSKLIDAIQKQGPIDVLINNAAYLVNKPFEKLTEQDWLDCYRQNVLAPFKLIQGILPFFHKPSHIVNIGSMGGFQGSRKFAGLNAYSASKAALHNLTESLAEELKGWGISVNALALGATQTAMLENAFPGHSATVSAEERGQFIADFALNAHRNFNGKIIPVTNATP